MPALPAYDEARLKAYQLVTSYKIDLTGAIDYVNQLLKTNNGRLGLVTDAYSERLAYKALLVGSSVGNGLAYLKDGVYLLGRLKKAFHKAATEVQRTNQPAMKEELAEIERDMGQYETGYERDVVAFFRNYQTQIDGERQTPAYARDHEVVSDVWHEMQQAMKSASWTPEMEEVSDRATGVLGARIDSTRPTVMRRGQGA